MIGLSAVIGFATACALIGALGMAYLAGLNAGPRRVVVEFAGTGVGVTLDGSVSVGNGVFVPSTRGRR